jgi:hypothetical protein
LREEKLEISIALSNIIVLNSLEGIGEAAPIFSFIKST